MQHTSLKLTILALSLIGTALPAQAYRVTVDTDYTLATGWSQEAPTQTSTFLRYRASGGCCSAVDFDAYAYSGPHQVDLSTYCYRQAAVSQAAYATAGWILNDVIFSGPAPGTPISVRMAFEIFDASSAGSPSQGLNQEVITHDVRVFDASNTQVAYWNRFLPGGQFWNATDSSMVSSTNFALASGQQILAGQPYRFDIRIEQQSGGNQGWTRCSSSVRLAPQPFVLPVGVTADSAQGGVVANAWTPSGVPQIKPLLSNSEPVTAGSPLTVFVKDCGAQALGILALGQEVVPLAIQIAPWASVQLDTLLAVESFVSDANGDWMLSVPLSANLSGMQFAMQAAVFTLSLDDLYSTNSVVVDVQ